MTSILREELQTAVSGTFVLERELPTSGMSHLFVATETALGRRVVLKVLPPEMSATLDIARFRREIQLAARLAHPNIVPLLSAGEVAGLPYYTMPYVDGESLHARLERSGQLPVGEVVSVLRDLAKALAYAHEHGVMHRDLKPDNVLLEQGTALLTDFGIAKAINAATTGGPDRTSAGIAVGTPMYVSPEQAAGDPRVDSRTDLYSLGIVTYEMLAGQPPFTHRTLQAILAAQQTTAPRPIASRRPDTPSWLAQLVMRLLEKQPADRPQSGDEVVRIIDASGAPPYGAPPAPPTPAVGPAGGRHARAQRPTSSRSVLHRAVAVALVMAIIVVVAVPARWHAGAAHVLRLPGRSAPAVDSAPAPLHSIAVLPLTVVGRDTAAQTFADGLADGLTTAIGALPRFEVASRESAFAVGKKPLTALQIGEALGVAELVEGAVERAGNQFRITLQLTDTRNGMALWSATYHYTGQDRFHAQDTIITAAVEALTRADTRRLAPVTESSVVSRPHS